MARIETLRVQDGVETLLEAIEVPDQIAPTILIHPEDYYEKLETHFKRTGKPRKKGLMLSMLLVLKLRDGLREKKNDRY